MYGYSESLITQSHGASKYPYVFRSGVCKFNDINPYRHKGKFVDSLQR